MAQNIYRVEIGETSLEESLRHEWQHYQNESEHQTGELGIIQGLLVLSGPQRTTKRFDRTFGLIVQETNQTIGVVWLGGIIGTVFHLAASHSELDGLKEAGLQESLNLMRLESPELHASVTELLSQPDHTLATRPTSGSGNSRRTKTIFSVEQLSPISFASKNEFERITQSIQVPPKRHRPLPISKTIGPDKVSF
jgi:hypothetical protein